MRSPLDLWIRHFKVRNSELVIRHDDGKLRLPLESIASHKHISLATLVIRQFSGHRYDLSISCFRTDEISALVSVLKAAESKNHARKLPEDIVTGLASVYLAAELERLMALPLTTPAELEHWNQERILIEKTLAERFPYFAPDDDVSHFFADADIRSRDSDYLNSQHTLMSEYVQRLRHRSPEG